MINKLVLLFSFFFIASSVNAGINELEKFNDAKSTFSFEENKGQISDQNNKPRPDVLFSGEVNGLTFHIRNNGVSYQTTRVDSWIQKEDKITKGLGEKEPLDSVPDQMTIYRTDINWLDFNENYTIENGDANAGFNNYYLPSCPNGALNVKTFTNVTFKNLYNGIDLKWYEKNGDLEYDFIVSPNADYSNISWEINGASQISIGENGQLIIETPVGIIEEQAPIAFQGNSLVEAAWKIEGNKISFQLGKFNPNQALTIDPVVRLWGTYYGGSLTEFLGFHTTDASDNSYLTGVTKQSLTGIATTGAYQSAYSGGLYDAFLVKFNSNGVRQWGTYYGGAGKEEAYSCVTDESGNVYIGGFTNSTSGIATAGAYQTTYGGGNYDAFLVKFNSNGIRLWATYYGGANTDQILSCATDTTGNVYVSGGTQSLSGIATTGAHQTTYGGSFGDAFLVMFNSSGVRQWGTYYGGSGDDGSWSCATDGNGNVYLSGVTESSTSGIATSNVHQSAYGGGQYDAYLAKFNSNGVRQWATYYGGSGKEQGYSCTTDVSSNVYLVGQTTSLNGMETIGAHQTVHGGGVWDAFLVKFNSNGVRQWGTYSGGLGSDDGYSCATDANGSVYLAGRTTSISGMATTGVHQTVYGGGIMDAYLVKFNSIGVRQWSTYYGGSGVDESYSCSIGAFGNVYLAGYTQSTNGIATTGAHQNTFAGEADIFLVKFSSCPIVYSQDTVSACNSFTWIDGVTYTSSNNTAVVTLVSSTGCDSVVTLDLTLTNIDSTITQNGFELTSNATGNVSYQWVYCDDNNSPVIGAINQSFTVSASGNYAVQITNGNCVVISDCINVTGVSVEQISPLGIHIYPNPTLDVLNIDKGENNNLEITILDNTGKVVINNKSGRQVTTIDMSNLATGIYYVKVISEGITSVTEIVKR